MGTSLRILMVDDSEDDVLLVLRHLCRAGYNPVYERVDNEEAMKSALRVPTWDLILCDYVMPKLSLSKALELYHERGVDVPFIVISGVFGEYLAARTIAAGAHDYSVKGDLERLVPAIKEALEKAQIRWDEKKKTGSTESASYRKQARGRG